MHQQVYTTGASEGSNIAQIPTHKEISERRYVMRACKSLDKSIITHKSWQLPPIQNNDSPATA